MKKWLKRIRGALGMGLTWAAAWAGLGAIIGLFPGGGPSGVLLDVFVLGVRFGVLGFIGGAIFSTVLGITEGRRRFDEMSVWRFGGWGALGGLLLPMLVLGGPAGLAGEGLFVGLVTVLCAGSAAGSLARARKAHDRELLDAGADVADIGLTEEEKRELLTE